MDGVDGVIVVIVVVIVSYAGSSGSEAECAPTGCSASVQLLSQNVKIHGLVRAVDL